VIGFCGLLFAFSLPTLTKYRETIKLEATARVIVADLRRTQCSAHASNESISSNGFTFSRTGFPTPGGSGTLVLSGHFARERKVIVSSVGRVRFE